jgi:Putative polyhydroxyalkanoic acid system protein (PHA_gran_rgn)
METSGAFMSQPLVVSIPHRLGKDEAVRRLITGLGNAQSNFGHLFKVQEEIWTGDRLQFRVSALTQVASGNIVVADDHVRLEVVLPWLLAKVATVIQPLIRNEAVLMPEKK